ncbi:heterokaryon incompatibility protein-domain-containing protein [Hypoxylon rubiginosum]|uniref:Heterokaryon incompatibility protein-domain-containing protein n=1 Tax=Hypoxylon rubiginosum TaxID=110542 RepID=A0ACB9YJ57_9PEZI|nr:heterokaryon incompatibility protein-domain-containing protein [Hypoxylon rubiginosum]
MEYKYHPLSAGPDEIRVLTLYPGQSSDDVQVALHHVSFREDKPPPFEALSYVWGSPANPVSVTIKRTILSSGPAIDHSPSCSLSVTQNLGVALRHLRDRVKPRTLWIDAICIDQSSTSERSQQVQRMDKIYQHAARVVIWLGPEADNSNAIMDILAEMGSSIRLDWATHVCEPSVPSAQYKILETKIRENGDAALTALSHLLARPWFERLWVVQEAKLSDSEAIVNCGQSTMHWDTFLKGVIGIYSDSDLAKATLNARLLAIMDLYFDVKNRMRLEELLNNTQTLQCSDKRDKIYAIMGLISEPLSIGVDYSLSVSQVYEDVFRRYLGHRRTLDLLTWCELNKNSPRRPTWVPDWSAPRITNPMENELVSFGGVADVVFLENGTLRVGAIPCTSIVRRTLAYPLDDGDDTSLRDFISRVLELLGVGFKDLTTPLYKTGCIFLEALCGSLNCLDFLVEFEPRRSGVPDLDSCISDLLYFLDPRNRGASDSEDSDFFLVRRYASRRPFITTQEGYFGLGPPDSKPGDVVYSILGCRSLMVLRPSAENKFQVVGECYLHGLNPGTMFLGPYPTNMFKLVLKYDESADSWHTRHRNKTTGLLSVVDPRLRSLGLYKGGGEPEEAPVIDAKSLKSIGVKLEHIHLI